MERSSKVLSLNGTSSMIVGLLATVGGCLASYLLYGNFNPFNWNNVPSADSSENRIAMMVLSVILVALSILIVFYMSYKRAKRLNIRFELDSVMKKMLTTFFVPLIIGGLLCLTQIFNGVYSCVASNMLIFYGISLISISSLTYSNVKYLVIGEILVGLLDSLIVGHSLFFWLVGFGLLHILYGLWFLFFYEKKHQVNKTDER
ncbi:MAG TPA: hypothetical protein PLN63_06870 [Paludibacteraceae bacterium]|nr:hypothetical protein [Paludibacteraceae bacterium]HOU67190.1 hypothetical protein [Paludibacteraceae bacterium]HPH63323.1 hypothetical protein [Paludibacteraceae bacterium]HQF50812.1 hypothetical protein [Paludibacteraceae bacterium]HQJ90631.1 hypothetical protein [Paludibacteraceae bacterium]